MKHSFVTKGNWYYEIQILMFVIMWQHDMNHQPSSTHGLRLGRLYIWVDSTWRDRGVVGEIRWFFVRLFRNVGYFRSWRAKLRVMRINLRHIPSEWNWLKFLKADLASIRSYLTLHQDGFRISHTDFGSKEPDALHIYRFFWDGEAIEQACDIDSVSGRYSTVKDGSTRPIGRKTIKRFE